MKKAGVFVLINVVWHHCGNRRLGRRTINPATAYDPVNDQYLVVYEQFEIDADETYLVTCQLVSSSGVEIGDPFDINPTASNIPPTSPSVVYHAIRRAVSGCHGSRMKIQFTAVL